MTYCPVTVRIVPVVYAVVGIVTLTRRSVNTAGSPVGAAIDKRRVVIPAGNFRAVTGSPLIVCVKRTDAVPGRVDANAKIGASVGSMIGVRVVFGVLTPSSFNAAVGGFPVVASTVRHCATALRTASRKRISAAARASFLAAIVGVDRVDAFVAFASATANVACVNNSEALVGVTAFQVAGTHNVAKLFIQLDACVSGVGITSWLGPGITIYWPFVLVFVCWLVGGVEF